MNEQMKAQQIEKRIEALEKAVIYLSDIIKKTVSEHMEGLSGTSDFAHRVEVHRNGPIRDSRSRTEARLDNLEYMVREMAWVVVNPQREDVGEIIRILNEARLEPPAEE